MNEMLRLPKFNAKFFLAPLAGVNDPAFRLLCKELGAGLTYTELMSVHAIIHHKDHIRDFIEYSDNEKPRAIQLFGSDIDKTMEAARIVEKHFDIIDFNLGCPSPKITEQNAGAALLKKPDHVKKLLSKLVKAVDIPITVKLRAGMDDKSCDLFKKIALIAEDAGVSMIALHARTLKQGYSGKANWEWIKELKENISIPIIGNGDIKRPEDAKRMFDETGCDYVMIGRAAMGNPYIFKQCNDYFDVEKYKSLNPEENMKYFFKYLEYTKDFKISYPQIKAHAIWFTKGIVGGAELRRKIVMSKDVEEIKKIIKLE